MLTVYQAAKKDGMPRSMQMQLLQNVLALGPKASVYDADLFTEFVKWRELRLESQEVQLAAQLAEAKPIEPHADKDWVSCVQNLSREDFDFKIYLRYFAF